MQPNVQVSFPYWKRKSSYFALQHLKTNSELTGHMELIFLNARDELWKGEIWQQNLAHFLFDLHAFCLQLFWLKNGYLRWHVHFSC